MEPRKKVRAAVRMPCLHRILLLAAALPPCSASPSAAATIEVTAIVDDATSNGNCTLREAIRAANMNVAQDECTGGDPGADTILLPAGTYRLTLAGSDQNAALGDLDIRDDVTILGAGRDVTVIDGDEIDRVFDVGQGDNTIVVAIKHLTVRDGSATADGGGIANRAGQGGTGSLSLYNVLVADSSVPGDAFGGGLWNTGRLFLRRTEVSGSSGGDGGGIFNEAGADLDVLLYSRITGNTAAANGGGISNGGDLSLDRVLIDGNQSGAANNGGGLINNGAASLINVTFEGNTGGPFGGAILNQAMGTLSLEHVTITNNSATSGGGIVNENTSAADVIEIGQTLLADNANGNCVGTGGATQSFGYNLEDANDCSLAATGDQVNVSDANIGLTPLQDNGGFLPTRGLADTSFAVDAGNPASAVDVDQRGTERPRDGDGDGNAVDDIGAFELQAPILVNSTDDGTDVNPGDGVCETAPGNGICTLRAAVQEGNSSVRWKLITIPAGVYELSLGGSGEDLAATGDLDLRETVTIRGAGVGATVIDGQDLDRVFDLPDGSTDDIAIEDLTIRNGDSGIINGGCLRSGLLNSDEDRLLLSRVLISDCEGGTGGGVDLQAGTLTEIVDSAVRDNTSSASGGGIFAAFQSQLLLLRTEVSDNVAQGSGGGVYPGIASLVDSTVSGNVTDNGGGMFTDALTGLVNTTIAGNTATSGEAGGVFVVGFTVFHNTIVADNIGGAGMDQCGGNTGISTFSRGGNFETAANTCNLTNPVTVPDLSDPVSGLAPLADNGGPTRTHALFFDSPALDNADPAGCADHDQRGEPRPIDGDNVPGAVCDIGAFEGSSCQPIVLENHTVTGSVTYESCDWIFGGPGLAFDAGADATLLARTFVALGEDVVFENGTEVAIGTDPSAATPPP